jgi:transposase
MPRTIGLDAHKRVMQFCVLGEDGELLAHHRLGGQREELLDFAERHLLPTDSLVLEATFHTWALVDLFRPYVARVVVSNPLRTRAIALAKVKTDKIDARVLADLLRSNYLPEVWQPDPETRRWRALTHRRSALVSDRTTLKNRIQSLLAQRLVATSEGDLFTAKGLDWLALLELDEDGRSMLESDLRLLKAVSQEIDALDAQIAPLAHRQDQARLLMTLPGVDAVVALALLAAWGDAKRFPDPDRAASALGLAPSTRGSGNKTYHGSITKQGNSHARWLLVQAAQHLHHNPGPLGVFFRRLKTKKNHNVAVVAAARKMATIAWWMLTRNEPYRYANPKTTQTKLARLRIRATQARRKGGNPKGQPRPKTYGQGNPMRTEPSLAQALQAEGLPRPRPLAELPEAEIRSLQNAGCLDHAISLQTQHLRPRKKKEAPTGQLTPS